MNTTWKQITLGTVIFANILLFALILAKPAIIIPPKAEAAIASSVEQTITEYRYELEDVTILDGWRIEHYQQYAITVNGSGEVIEKKPTRQTENIKYRVGD